MIAPVEAPGKEQVTSLQASEPRCVDIFMPAWQVTGLPDRVVSAAGGYLDFAVGRNRTTMSIKKARCSSFV